MFIPSKRTWTDMMNESAGFWPVPIDDGKATAFLLKASTNVIKAAYKGVSIELSIVISHTKSGDVLSTALTIYDDSKSPMILPR
jgi:hypothetical protein